MKNKISLVFGALLLIFLTPAMADPVIVGTSSFNASGTTTSGVTGNASAVLSIEGGKLKIVLTNNLNVADFSTYSVGSNVSGFQVNINGAYDLSDFSLSASQVDVSMNDFTAAYSPFGAKPDGWGIASSGLTALGFTGTNGAPPDQTIIGSGSSDYSKLNNSIKNNDPHQPIILQTATFYLDLPSALASAQEIELSDAQFYFGTNAATITKTPEPGTLLLLGTGLLGLGLRRRFVD